LVALSALLLATSAGERAGAASQAPADLYWLGPYFAGLELTGTDRSFTYGECELPEGEGGCYWPVEIENSTTCESNPIRFFSGIPQEVFLLRGEGLAVYDGALTVDVFTGLQTARVHLGEFEVVGAALRELHTQSQSAPQPLAAPVFPMPVLRELKRVTAVEDRYGGIRAIAEATDLWPDEVRLRLRIAKLLGPDALAGVPAPTMSIATVKRLGELAFGVQTHNLAHTAERHGMSVASLRKKIRRVRGLAGGC
jgi:hypothetical protein